MCMCVRVSRVSREDVLVDEWVYVRTYVCMYSVDCTGVCVRVHIVCECVSVQ